MPVNFSNCSEFVILLDASLFTKLAASVTAAQVHSSGLRQLEMSVGVVNMVEQKICVALNAKDPKRYVLKLTVAEACDEFKPDEVVAVRKHDTDAPLL